MAAHRAAGRRPALRLRTDGHSVAFDDRVVGRVEGTVDDVVLRRNDGVPAYNLAVVVDDGAQGIDDVVRGDDLVSSTPRQIHLQRLLGLPQPTYTHVPLVLGTDGERLAKRHGAVTLGDLEAAGVSPGGGPDVDRRERRAGRAGRAGHPRAAGRPVRPVSPADRADRVRRTADTLV